MSVGIEGMASAVPKTHVTFNNNFEDQGILSLSRAMIERLKLRD